VIAVVEWVLIGIGAVLAIPVAVFALECFVALFPMRRRTEELAAERPRTALLMPAHDEEPVIEATLRPLLAELGSEDRIVVVADNCSDKTAAIARRVGAIAYERTDPERRGKGYAIEFGMKQIEASPEGAPEIVIILDADCRVAPGSIATLARTAKRFDRPIQADYVIKSPDRSAKAVVSALAILVRNRVRPCGLHRLGLPVLLTGSGMAFPWRVLREAPSTGSYLVEDMLMGIEMAIRGRAPRLCPEACVTSVLPERDQAAIGQRRRWEHGSLATMAAQAPRLCLLGFTKMRIDLLALGLDLAVPPLALLVTAISAHGAASAAAWLLGASLWPLAISGTAMALVGFAVLGAWFRYARRDLPLRYLLGVPLYVLWKIPLYLSFFARRGQKSWVRTERAKEAPARSDRED
jgi:cellulose synthase/poly-beta-1,6-N-acetylglucosamine synthase-like glycosyltransferase